MVAKVCLKAKLLFPVEMQENNQTSFKEFHIAAKTSIKETIRMTTESWKLRGSRLKTMEIPPMARTLMTHLSLQLRNPSTLAGS